jgi:hypothetical protein
LIAEKETDVARKVYGRSEAPVRKCAALVRNVAVSWAERRVDKREDRREDRRVSTVKEDYADE